MFLNKSLIHNLVVDNCFLLCRSPNIFFKIPSSVVAYSSAFTIFHISTVSNCGNFLWSKLILWKHQCYQKNWKSASHFSRFCQNISKITLTKSQKKIKNMSTFFIILYPQSSNFTKLLRFSGSFAKRSELALGNNRTLVKNLRHKTVRWSTRVRKAND